MSCQGSATKDRPGKLLAFTRWGILFFFLSVLILLIGALRMELAAILWGSAFCLLALYSLLANRIMQAILRRFYRRQGEAKYRVRLAALEKKLSRNVAQLQRFISRARAAK